MTSRRSVGALELLVAIAVVAGLVTVALLPVGGAGPGGDHPSPLPAAPARAHVLSASLPSLGWHPLHPAASPDLSSSGLVYDAADGYFVLFGGTSCYSPSQTWTFAAGNWTELTGAGAPPFPGTLTYDASDGYVLLYVGSECPPLNSNTSGWVSETWAFHNGNWTNITSSSQQVPPAREGAQMTYDASLGRVVLYGGYCGGLCPAGYPEASNGLFNDTWEFHAGNWTRVGNGSATGTTASSPPPLDWAAFGPDPTGGGVILFGGGADDAAHHGSWTSASTWRFNGSTWTNVSPSSGPGALTDASLLGTSDLGGTILFGGTYTYPPTSVGAPFVPNYYNATWRWNGSSWTNLSLTPSPSPRALAGFAYDPTDGYALLYGGFDRNSTLHDTWILNTSTTQTTNADIPVTFAASGLTPGTNWSVELSANLPGLSILANPAVVTRWSDGGSTVRFTVSPGTYEYVASAPGRPSESGTVTAAQGSTASIGILFSETAPPGPAPTYLPVPLGALVLGLALVVVSALGIGYTALRQRARTRRSGELLATRLAERDWASDERGRPVPFRGR